MGVPYRSANAGDCRPAFGDMRRISAKPTLFRQSRRHERSQVFLKLLCRFHGKIDDDEIPRRRDVNPLGIESGLEEVAVSIKGHPLSEVLRIDIRISKGQTLYGLMV